MIIDKARELGLAISESEEFRAMNEAQHLMESDSETMAKLDAFNEKQNRIMELMSGEDGSAEEMSELSTGMEQLRGELLANEVFVRMMESQNAFQELMKRVNRVIGMCIGMEPEDDEEGGCGGDCSACHGCH